MKAPMWTHLQYWHIPQHVIEEVSSELKDPDSSVHGTIKLKLCHGLVKCRTKMYHMYSITYTEKVTKVQSRLSKCRIWKDFGGLRYKGYQLAMSLATFGSPSVTPHFEYFLMCRSSNTYFLLLTKMWTRVHLNIRESRNKIRHPWELKQIHIWAESITVHSFCLSLSPFSPSNHRKEITGVFESALLNEESAVRLHFDWMGERGGERSSCEWTTGSVLAGVTDLLNLGQNLVSNPGVPTYLKRDYKQVSNLSLLYTMKGRGNGGC